MGLQESTKGNAQLTRENDIFHINQTTVLFNRDSTYSLVRKFICFFKKGHRNCKRHIFGEHFYSENARKLRFHVFLLFHARKHMMPSFYLTWSVHDIVSFVAIVSPRGDPNQSGTNSQTLEYLVHSR